MGGILAKALFSVGGRVISVKTILKLIGVVIIAGLLWLAYSKVSDHFDHINDLETANTQLQQDKDQLQRNLDEAVRINQQNAKVTQATTEQRAAASSIGNTEAAASVERNLKYKGLQDEIKASPIGAEPVDPLIRRTLERVWQ